MFLESSTDGVTWKTQYMFATPFSVADVEVRLQAGLPTTTSQPDSVQFADLNTQ
jgi:hypothetical protein